MLNGHNNSDRDHGVELVSYIYNEMDPTARGAFESHLASCGDCAEELASFADARLGIVEWKRTDFENLATPAIEIPYRRPSSAPVATGIGFRSLLESIFASPVFARAGIGLAAAALLVGVIYFAGLFQMENPDVAEVPATWIQPLADAPDNRSAEPVKREDIAADGQLVSGPRDEPAPFRTATPSRLSADRSNSASRASVARRKIVPNENRVVRRLNSDTATTRAQQKVPSLNNFEEEEDKTLRLADLFDEVGAGG